MPNAKKKTVLHQVEPENPAANSAMRRIIFISHSNPEDNDFTTWLAARLALAGYEVWSDITKLIGGEVFWKDIEEAIRHHSIRFLSVLSVSAPSKRGFMKELSVADAIEGHGKLGDFIIPVRIDDIPFSDIPIQIHNKNVIDFTAGWHLGLARILKKFEQDKVPQSPTDLATSLSEWDINELEELRIPVVTQTEDTRRENDRMMLNLKGSINESYRKDIGRRVRNKQRLLAGNRRPAGGRAYGYIPASRSESGKIELNETEAEIIRQIFAWRASGWSGKRIAAELNERKVPAPGAGWNRRRSVANAKRTNGEWVRTAIIGDVRRGIGILNN